MPHEEVYYSSHKIHCWENTPLISSSYTCFFEFGIKNHIILYCTYFGIARITSLRVMCIQVMKEMDPFVLHQPLVFSTAFGIKDIEKTMRASSLT